MYFCNRNLFWLKGFLQSLSTKLLCTACVVCFDQIKIQCSSLAWKSLNADQIKGECGSLRRLEAHVTSVPTEQTEPKWWNSSETMVLKSFLQTQREITFSEKQLQCVVEGDWFSRLKSADVCDRENAALQWTHTEKHREPCPFGWIEAVWYVASRRFLNFNVFIIFTNLTISRQSPTVLDHHVRNLWVLEGVRNWDLLEGSTTVSEKWSN